MNICVYCASSNTIDQLYIDAAHQLGQALGERNWSLVYGGGTVGLMGAVAESTHRYGGQVIGIIPQALLDREIGNLEADELIVTLTMRERKRLMEERADVFVTLPGGFGTLEELLEIITLRQLLYHDKPIIIINLNNYYRPLLDQFEAIFDQRFTSERYRTLYTVVDTIDEALELLDAYIPPAPPDEASATEYA